MYEIEVEHDSSDQSYASIYVIYLCKKLSVKPKNLVFLANGAPCVWEDDLGFKNLFCEF